MTQTLLKALLCAPLKVGERVIGVIALGSTVPMPYTAAELKLLNTLALQTATAIENARLFERTIQAAKEREQLLALHQAAELARAKLEGEMKLAARIQADLFPAELPQPDGYQLAARNRPARRCGGDYYDALTLAGPSTGSGQAGAERLLLCVADVSGKGLPAALLMSNMQATLRALLGRIPSLPLLAGHASDLLFAATSPEKYVTAALAELEPATGRLRFVGAGHLDNVILRADGSIVSLGLHRRTAGPAAARAAVRRDQRDPAPRRRAGAVLRRRHRRAGPPTTRSSARRGCTTSCDRWQGSPPKPSSTASSPRSRPSSPTRPQFDDMTMLVVDGRRPELRARATDRCAGTEVPAYGADTFRPTVAHEVPGVHGSPRSSGPIQPVTGVGVVNAASTSL